jgi:hypothetical protein
MIQSILEAPTALTSNSSVVTFTEDTIRSKSATCCGFLQHEEGTPNYKLLEGGIYKVSFNANVTSATAGEVALGLFADGVLVPGTTIIAPVTTAGDYINVAFDKIIKACCKATTNLTIASVPSVLTGVTPTATATQIPIIQNANFAIVRKS